MYCTDFIFDDNYLSEYNAVICNITIDSTGFQIEDIGSVITFNTVNNLATGKSRLVSAQYDNMYTTNFQIAKLDCTGQEVFFDSEQIVQIRRWLGQKEFKKFRPFYENAEYPELYYIGSFTSVQPIVINGGVIGFDLTFNANAPYGFLEPFTHTFSFGEGGGDFEIWNHSDELGYLYCKITLEDIGSIEEPIIITNKTINKKTVVTNYAANNTIIIDGENKIIMQTTEDLDGSYTKKLMNGFNYVFPQIYNDLNSRVNKFNINTACTITLEYTPISKNGAI